MFNRNLCGHQTFYISKVKMDFDIKLRVTVSKGSTHMCEICGNNKDKGQIIVKSSDVKRQVHLWCYDPIKYILNRNIKLPSRFLLEDIKEFRKWLGGSNERFLKLDMVDVPEVLYANK